MGFQSPMGTREVIDAGMHFALVESITFNDGRDKGWSPQYTFKFRVISNDKFNGKTLNSYVTTQLIPGNKLDNYARNIARLELGKGQILDTDVFLKKFCKIMVNVAPKKKDPQTMQNTIVNVFPLNDQDIQVIQNLLVAQQAQASGQPAIPPAVTTPPLGNTAQPTPQTYNAPTPPSTSAAPGQPTIPPIRKGPLGF